MRLYRFLNEHIDEILAEWEAFAKTQGPAAELMSSTALRDHAKGILQAISLDIETHQNSEQQAEKSKGHAPDADAENSAASIHGALRQASNFSLLQLSAEFRALRASVLRLWLPHVDQMSADTIYEMVRFNEAIDQALAESVITYSARAEHTRDLFLAILGHDLRAPLSSMAMAGELLTHPEVTHDQIAKNGARVKRSARLMSSMVEDLLGYTRTQLGSGMPVTLARTDIKDICQSAVEDASAVHLGRKFQLDAAGDLVGYFDSVRLHQLFANLFVNAAQYGAKEHPVVITARGDADAVTIEVTNQGPVIPEASLQSIFTPLVQLPREDEKDTRPRTSLGLGLFVAREIAMAHGGAIAVKSDSIAGTTFTVRLPRTATA